jgi:hypothetical protein
MQIYNYTDFAQNMSKVFNTALVDDVIVKDTMGNKYKITPVRETVTGKSPIEGIPTVKLNMTTQEIVEILHENRAGV